MATFSRNFTQPHLKKLTNVPEVPVTQLYKDMINVHEPVPLLTIKDDEEDSSIIWTILKHPGTYIGTISMILYYVQMYTVLDSGSGLSLLGTSLISKISV